MLAREVLRLRGTISRNLPWETDVMPDLFFYRDPEEQEKEEAAKAEAAKAEADAAKIEVPVAENWGGDVADDTALAAAAAAATAAAQTATPVPAAAAAGAAASPAPAAPDAAAAGDDWNQSVDDWAATPATTTG